MTKRRYAIELTDKLDKLLEALAEEKGTTKAEIIRRAIASYSYLEAEQDNGSKVIIENEETKTRREIVFR